MKFILNEDNEIFDLSKKITIAAKKNMPAVLRYLLTSLDIGCRIFCRDDFDPSIADNIIITKIDNDMFSYNDSSNGSSTTADVVESLISAADSFYFMVYKPETKKEWKQRDFSFI